MIPRFSFVRARSLDEAFEAFAAGDGDVAYICGGTELLQVMKMGLAAFGTLVDLKAIDELHGIVAEPDGRLGIGAATPHRKIERSTDVERLWPALVELESHVANVRVRNQGTLGGNLVFAEPHSDPATFLLAAGGSVELAGPGGRRSLPIDQLVLGPLTTALEPGEVMTRVELPVRSAGEGIGYAKIAFFERPSVAVAVRLRVDSGSVADATVTVGSVVDSPQVVPGAGAALTGATISEPLDGPFAAALEACRGALAEIPAVSDLDGSADYKRHLAGVLATRAAGQAVREAMADA
jgi:carbon-monoxide dehydrogenase medium subunit